MMSSQCNCTWFLFTLFPILWLPVNYVNGELWLSRIFGDHHNNGVVRLHTLQDQFKVYMIMCNMKVADIEAMMSQLAISETPDGFLAWESDTSVAFERLQVLHQCCTDHVYRNDSVIIKIYQSRVEHWLDDEMNWVRMDELWAATATPIDDSPGELRTKYSEYRDWLYDVLRNKLSFMPFRRSGEADPL